MLVPTGCVVTGWTRNKGTLLIPDTIIWLWSIHKRSSGDRTALVFITHSIHSVLLNFITHNKTKRRVLIVMFLSVYFLTLFVHVHVFFSALYSQTILISDFLSEWMLKISPKLFFCLMKVKPFVTSLLHEGEWSASLCGCLS